MPTCTCARRTRAALPLLLPILLLSAFAAASAAAPRDAEVHDDWRGGGALALLETLRRHDDVAYRVGFDGTRGFVREGEVAALIALLSSEEPCAVVLQIQSAHLPNRRSTIGHEAGLLLEAFRQGRYPLTPASDLHPVDAAALRAWWQTWQRQRPGRALPPEAAAIAGDTAYVADFRLGDGWQPVGGPPGVRVELSNLDAFGHLRFGVWKEARITFRVLEPPPPAPDGAPAGAPATLRAEILRVE